MLIRDSRIEKIVNLLIEIDNDYSSLGKNQAAKAAYYNRREANEMLTIKELAERNKGISESSIRKWVRQNKFHYIRAGETNNGKILISQASFDDFLNGRSDDFSK